MDKEKLKRYAGYVGLGTLGIYLGILLGDLVIFRDLNDVETNYLSPAPLIFGVVVGILGGGITKKWWGALVGGLILSGLINLITFSLYSAFSSPW